MTATTPVLLVHGIWNTGANFDPLSHALSQRAPRALEAVSLVPNDGSARLEALARQLEPAVTRLLAHAQRGRIDVVGFSMGALVARYWLQRLGGKGVTRRFVSIAGPHRGTLVAWGSANAGVLQMRPSSDFLRDLAADPDPFESTEVHTLGTPFDLMIVPSSSCQALQNSKSHTSLNVLLHRWMLTDRRAISKVTTLLDAP